MIILPTAPAVQILHISGIRQSADDANLRIVSISWKETTIGQHTIYMVTVEPAVQECNDTCVTNKTYLELKLAIGTVYSVTIITMVCNGSLQSMNSKPFTVLFNGTF